MYDLNDTEPYHGSELIPDGTFAKVTMTIRPGGVDGQGELDKRLLKASNSPGSDVLSLDAELTVVEGPHVRRKFWQLFTVAGGKIDEKGASIGWNISKRIFRAMVDSALGLDPEDMSEAAKQKRQLRGLADLSGITFVAKIAVEPNKDSRYPDQNKLDRPVLSTDKEWRLVMDGKDVPPSPSRPRGGSGARSQPSTPQPAWQQPQAQAAPAAGGPAWQHSGAQPSAPVAPPAPAAQPAKPAGPAWLNG
jgi:hypothetical protein